MQEEISLREIIDTIWEGKWIIAIVTAVAIVATGIISAFVLSPVYEAEALIRIENMQENENILSYTEPIKSDVQANKVISALKLNLEQYSINGIKNSITVDVPNNSNIVKIRVKGDNPQDITKIVNYLAFELGARVEISDRSEIIVQSRTRLEELDDSIALVQAEINETLEQLQDVPATLITKKTLSEDAYLQSVIAEQINASNKDIGALQLITEEINELYTTLQTRLKESTIELSKLQEEKQIHLAKIQENEAKINELTKQLNEDNLQNTQRLLKGFKAVFITPALEPVKPVGPKVLFNMVIAAVIGGMLSVIAVFLRKYLQQEQGTHLNNKAGIEA